MKSATPIPHSVFRTRRSGAFTLIEVMVVVVLMSVVILGLTAMFVQTQRAFKAGMTQTDVLEAGRMATEMVSRELEQIKPAYSTLNFGRTNFYTVLENEFPQFLVASAPAERTNLLSRMFFLTHENQTWTGIGYFLAYDNSASPVLPVGSLNRFELSTDAFTFERQPWLMISNFNRAIYGQSYQGTVSKILDGVISFNFRTYDTNGYWITPALPPTPIGQIWTHSDWSPVFPPANYPPRVDYHFTSNAVPAFVEFELGVVEEGALDHFRSIPVWNNQSNYLRQQAGRVHLFRQRVKVRNVDQSAY